MPLTAARSQLAIADRLNWRYAPLDAEVVCANAALETVRHEAAEGRSRLSHGGLEIGGILLGRRTDRSIQIVRALPIECEHKLGPLFILSAADERALDAALTSDKLGALQPVGLYVSHSRRGFAVAETESKILDRLPAGPWQLVLVVMPAKFGPARAGFFIRGAVDRSFVCAYEFLLTQLGHRPEAPVNRAPLPPVAPVVVEANPVDGHTTPLQRLYGLLAQVRRHWKLSQWNMATTLTLLLLFVSAGGLWVRARGVPPTSVPMHVSDLGTNLRIEWNPAQKAVRTASRGTLEIRDGERGPVAIPVTRGELDKGGVLYVPHSDNIELRFKLMRGSVLSSESVLYFINPQRRAASPPAAPAAVPPRALVSAEVPLAAGPPATAAKAPQALPESQPEQPVRQVVEKRAELDAEKPVKTFQLPAGQPVIASSQGGPMNLPDLPDINTPTPTLPTLPSANVSPIEALLAAPARFAGPPQLRGGRLIWTGALRKNAVLSITSAGASSGVLSGRLPGVPVRVSLQPAELVDGGIAVYSKDPERSSADQPAAAWNGWKVVVYDWDPKRIAEVNMVEPPGPANNWNRLVLRNGNRNVSVFVVNWQRF